MPNTRTEDTVAAYECPVAGKTVDIHKTWSILLDNFGAERARAPKRTSCSNQDHCVVATHNGSGTTYDWSKCAYVKGRAP